MSVNFCKGNQQERYISLPIYLTRDEQIDKCSPHESWKTKLHVPELPQNRIVTWAKFLNPPEYKFPHM